MKKTEYRCDLCSKIQLPKNLLCYFWRSAVTPQGYCLVTNLDASDKHICLDCLDIIKNTQL